MPNAANHYATPPTYIHRAYILTVDVEMVESVGGGVSERRESTEQDTEDGEQRRRRHPCDCADPAAAAVTTKTSSFYIRLMTPGARSAV